MLGPPAVDTVFALRAEDPDPPIGFPDDDDPLGLDTMAVGTVVRARRLVWPDNYRGAGRHLWAVKRNGRWEIVVIGSGTAVVGRWTRM